MKIYFNSTFIEKERVTDDLWVKGNNGNRLEAYFDDLDLSNTNIRLRLVIEWSNGETSNELPLNKNFKNDFAYINLPKLKFSGETKFTIRVYQDTYLLQTAIFSRFVKESVNASDETNITSTEYNALLNQIDEVNNNLVGNANYNEQVFDTLRGDINSSNDSIKALDDNIKELDEKTTLLEGTVNSTREVVNGLENRVANNEHEIEIIKEFGIKDQDTTAAISVLKNRVELIEDAYIKSVVYNVQNGIFTFTKQDGTIFEVDLAIEKVVANFKYNQSANALELTLADGTIQTVPMSDFAKAFEGVENDQIQVVVQSGNRIQAILKDNSVTYEKLSDDVKEMLERGGSSSGESNDFSTEQRVISDWSALAEGNEPYTHYAEVTLSTLTKAKSVELINDKPVLFAKYGFAIASVVGNVAIVYSIEKPVDDVTLKFELRFSGTVEQLLLQSLEGVC